MEIRFHGTTKENVDIILKTGFKAGTYFGKHLEDAIHMGGDCVFEVLFEESPTDYWEYISSEVIPASKIRSLINYSPEVLFHSNRVDFEIKKLHTKEDYDESVTVCLLCNGRGQMENYLPLTRWRDREKITACSACNGHGVICQDGGHPHEHKISK